MTAASCPAATRPYAVAVRAVFLETEGPRTTVFTAFHTGNFHAAGGFNPYGFHGIFSAISTGGVIFAYLGFEQAIQLGGESCNPRRNIPLAVIGAMVFGVVLYVLLQVAFLG